MLKHLRIWNIGFLYTVIYGWPRLIQLVYATIESYGYYSSKEIKLNARLSHKTILFKTVAISGGGVGRDCLGDGIMEAGVRKGSGRRLGDAVCHSHLGLIRYYLVMSFTKDSDVRSNC